VRDTANARARDLDTAFRIASMTKSFTALSILKLRDEGKLSSRTRCAKHVPELAGLAYPTRDSAPLTIRQLLTHFEGFPEDNPWGDRQLAIGDDVFARWLAAGSRSPPRRAPRSNTPTTASRSWAGSSRGRPARAYRDYVEQKILRPLG
jgi:CubicO group peptidase (beta-lactamase class C family)